MPNAFFSFKQFTVHQQHTAMKVCTDACIFGAWVADYLEKNRNDVTSILDVGTGTGLLSLMLAQKIPAEIDAVEIEPSAAIQAKENFSNSPWVSRLNVIPGNYNHLTFSTGYDHIIANPPFFANDLKSSATKRNLALHSSQLSLNELVKKSADLLNEQGQFSVLLTYQRYLELIGTARRAGLFPSQVVHIKQTPRHEYFRTMAIFSRQQTPLNLTSLVIKENDSYTPLFTLLLRNYYLHL